MKSGVELIFAHGCGGGDERKNNTAMFVRKRGERGGWAA